MYFLADESCDFAVVRALRQAGHDVTAITEISPYLRFPASARSGIGAAVVDAIAGSGSRFAHRFVVVQPGRLRIID